MTPRAMDHVNGIPALGFGTYPLKGEEAVRAVSMALELGLRHIDTAQMYGNEKQVGQAIAASGIPRSELFIVTKVDPSNLGAARFAGSVARSAEDLGTVPDLLLIHWPPADSPIDGPVERIIAEQQKGMARLIGVSNFNTAMLRRAQEIAKGALICNQVEFHPLLDQSKILATARDLGMVLTAYSPLAHGKAMEQPAVQEIARRHGCPASAVVLRWIIQQGVAAIPMTSKRANAEANLAALDITLSDEEMAAVSALTIKGTRLIDPSWMAGRWDRA